LFALQSLGCAALHGALSQQGAQTQAHLSSDLILAKFKLKFQQWEDTSGKAMLTFLMKKGDDAFDQKKV
jgi:hypothetical protein